MARIAVGGFHHETNCFVAEGTDFAYFASHRDRPPLVRGAEVIEWLADTSFALSGFLRDMGARHEIVPLLWTSGGAGGLVTADAYERIAGELVGRLSAAMPVDAVYLDLHGAMVSAPFEDGEGELLRRVRAVVGDATPIAISLDYHANVTPEMVEHDRQPRRLSHLPARRSAGDRRSMRPAPCRSSWSEVALPDAPCASCRS